MANIGEFNLIAHLTKNLSAHDDVLLGVGDDCAILDVQSDLLLLATCDSQVEGVHFTLHTSSPEQIGRKALAVNISDIAAMGGIPRYALVSLILPSTLSFGVLERIYVGMRQEAEQYSIAIVGGNIAGSGKAEQLVIDITLLGMVERGHALTRQGAHVGDTIFVTGSLGDSAAGFYTLLHADRPYPQDAMQALRLIHQVPRPRVQEGRALSQLGPQIVTAMLDISDGLSGDLAHLCERSQVGVRIEVGQLPLSAALLAIATTAAQDPLAWALHGGEDYGLLFTVVAGKEQEVIKAVRVVSDTPVTAIGKVCSPDEGMQLLYPNGHGEKFIPDSWDHLKGK
ncbi:MAG: thiamine-phosphate kinase [Ktedonobacteraceae bacterium]|nr:thiamine-phosphate kinase [Ktedonobacteraceae bacterium]